ncbi:MAG: hypothetical protein V1764_02765 [Nitrospirota bacterium]
MCKVNKTNSGKNIFFSGCHLKKVLIIAVDRNLTIKALLEDEFVEQLKAGGTEAVPSYRIFSEEENIDKRVIASKVKELQLVKKEVKGSQRGNLAARRVGA